MSFGRRYFVKTIGATAIGTMTSLAGCASNGGDDGGQNGGSGNTPAQTTQNTSTTTPAGTATENAAGNAAGETGQSTTHTVGMYTQSGSYYFDPIGLYVQPGDTIEWILQSGSHSTTSYSQANPSASTTLIPQDAQPWNSGTISSGSYSHTFETRGTCDYYCIPHKTLGMVGRIVCGEPGGPATQQSIPNKPKQGSVPPSDVIVNKQTVPFPYSNR